MCGAIFVPPIVNIINALILNNLEVYRDLMKCSSWTFPGPRHLTTDHQGADLLKWKVSQVNVNDIANIILASGSRRHELFCGWDNNLPNN